MNSIDAIPWEPDQATHYSTDMHIHGTLCIASPAKCADWIEYILWETTPAERMAYGVPTNTDVLFWIDTLGKRLDSNHPRIEGALFACQQYIDQM